MPRRVDYTRRRAELSDFERRRRNRTYTVNRSSVFIDTFPGVQGTLPEKMVYSKLIEFGFYFEFQTFRRFQISQIRFNKDYRPDFVLPNEKIIIEVQGSYWHSQAKQIESDAFKFAIYQMLGWKVLAWWDYEIYDHLDQLFFDEPRLARHDRYGKRIITGKEAKRDDSAGIRTLNRKRAERNAYKKIIKTKQPRNARKAITSRSIF